MFSSMNKTRTSTPGASLHDMAPNLSAAFCAGVISSVVSTIAQVALWGICMESSWLSLLNRDIRLTAAILMGREVLPPPVTVDWQVITVATFIHFVLSIAYSFFFAFLVSRLNKKLWLAAGLIYGLAIYGVNMYGMTFIYPWFSEVRDWITVAGHAVFGICLAGAYSKLSGTRS